MTDRADVRADIRDFLVSRRAKVTPEQAGLPPGENRRVPGLRRVEVAMLAGVSVEYYSRLERGHASGVSESVVEAVSRALGLDDAERTHLLDLIRASGGGGAGRRRPTRRQVRAGVQRVLDVLTDAPAFVLSGRLDVLAANALGRALFSPVFAGGGPTPNNALFTFLDPQAPTFFRDWDKTANDCVALLRVEAGRDPHDREVSDLIGALATRSEEFRQRWAAHDVRIHTFGTKRLHHPTVGDVDLGFESLPLPDDPSQSLLVYTAEPHSPSADALRVLASWEAAGEVTQVPGPPA